MTKYSHKPQVGDVVCSIEYPSGRATYQSWDDFVADNFYVHRTFFAWAWKLWWKSLKRRVRRQAPPGRRTIAEALRRETP